ncbi:helix-turn-helix domain-containing protein [Nocardia sp. BMG51109]|uniref:helix-turn-helix domain-containing protein n=1 Tax=Nocardia sp. BMG51109 TaxID=1056816 RepID=UPI0004670941|nr:helix-turn-helix domain-containing protein [Nocardia sp. BMG51109]
MSGIPANTVIDIRSTPELAPGQALEQWESVLSESYFPLAVSNPQMERFHSRVRAVTYGAVGGSLIEGTPQRVYRSRRHVDRPDEPILMALFATAGRGTLEGAGRDSVIEPGGLLLYDNVQPCAAHFGSTWGLLSMQVQLPSIVERTGISIGRLPINVRIPSSGAVGVIERFFRDLLEVQQTDPEAAARLGEHAVDLMASAVLLACGAQPTEQSAQALARQQALAFVRRHYTDPDLTTEQIAQACAVSRRTLYRLFEDVEGGVGAMVRRRRIGTAQALLRVDGVRSLESIAAACGFASDRHFYRAFKQATGMTPGEYRALQHPADRPPAQHVSSVTGHDPVA